MRGWGVGEELGFRDEAELHWLGAGHDAGAGAGALLVVLGEAAGCGGAGEEGCERGAEGGVVVGLVGGGHVVWWPAVGAGVRTALRRRAGVGGVVVVVVRGMVVWGRAG